MMKKLYFCETNGYNMVVSVDNGNKCRYLTETNGFPYIAGMDTEQKKQAARAFLASVEDDSSWENDCTYSQIFTDGARVLAETTKEI